ncbi:MAG: DDE-type integrase/transposase/recombinase, partial [Sweet potato little leaf phytoplasma]|nr:DDE-type integrase/transposase/recombinase [Sweet potato little leaf phytoplasma]
MSNSTLALNNILHVPAIKKNMISIASLTADNNVLVEFHANYFLVKDKASRRVMLHGILKDGLYQVELPSIQNPLSLVKSFSSAAVRSASNNCPVSSAFHVGKSKFCKVPLSQWHSRLGHASARVVKNVLKSCNVSVSLNENFDFCDACQKGKSHRLPFNLSHSHTWHPLELVHCDLWGPAPIASTFGYKFYISFVDDFTRMTHIFPLKTKSEAFKTFCQYKSLVENRFEKKIKILQTDWGGEFRSFSSFLNEHGIEFRHSCPHTSQQNGVVEHKHRHIVEMGLTLLAHASMPLSYWWEDKTTFFLQSDVFAHTYL